MALRLILNGEATELDVQPPVSIGKLIDYKKLQRNRIALALNGEVIPRERWDDTLLREGDEIDIVHAVGGGAGTGAAAPSSQPGAQPGTPAPGPAVVDDPDPLIIAGVRFSSRLFVGTGKYPDAATMVESLRRSGTEMVTLAIRRINLDNPDQDAILPHLDRSRYRLLPNTAGAYTVEQAVKLARLGREVTGTNWVKLEVIGDPETLWPDVAGTVEATKILVKEGFVVLPYTSPDIVAALRLEDAGAATVMPLASLIGSGQGFIDWENIQRIIDRVKVPVVIDAGLGAPSDAALAMELGADAVLINTAIAKAQDPPRMAEAMAWAVAAGRAGFLAGRIPKGQASPSSPTTGVID